MMKIRNSRSKLLTCFLYGAISLLGLVVAGCGAQSGLMTRPQPTGGEIVNPWLPTQEREFKELEKSFLEQIARAERLNSGSSEVRRLKSEYEKVKRLWQLKQEEGVNELPEISELPDTFVNSVGITMKLIKPGSFMMGSSNGYRQKPVHKVTITKPFYIGAYEITGEQYIPVMFDNGLSDYDARIRAISGMSGPITGPNWNDSMTFCKKLSMKEGLNYTLPTEAQWEYACRAGTTTIYSFGDQWDEASSREPNPWGLYDMHGNLREWCSDWYGRSYYKRSPSANPIGPVRGRARVRRGGCWLTEKVLCPSAFRGYFNPNSRHGLTGFRVVLLPD